MAVFRVRAPDGSTLRIEGPDDATDDEIAAFAEQQFAASPKPSPAAYEPQEPGVSDPSGSGLGAEITAAAAPAAPPAEKKFGLPADRADAALADARVRAEKFLAKNPKKVEQANNLYRALAKIKIEDAQLQYQQDTKNESIELGDIGPLLGSGSAGLVRGVGELTGSETLTNAGRDAGEFYDAKLSDAAKNPLNAVAGVQRSIVESLPGTAVGGGIGGLIGRGAGAALAGTNAGRAAELSLAIAGKEAPLLARAIGAAPTAVGGGVGEGLVSGAGGAASAADEFDKLTPKQLAALPRYKELQDEGLSVAQAKEALRTEFIRNSAAQQALATAAIGTLFPGVESRIADSIAGRAVRSDLGVLGQAGITALKETGQETLQGYGEQVAQNIAARSTIDPTRDVTEGALVNASMSGLAGAGTGFVGGGAAALSDKLAAANQLALSELPPLQGDSAGTAPAAPSAAPAAPSAAPAAPSAAPAAPSAAPAPAPTIQPLADLTPLVVPAPAPVSLQNTTGTSANAESVATQTVAQPLAQPLADLTPLLTPSSVSAQPVATQTVAPLTPRQSVVKTTSDADLLASVGAVDASRTDDLRAVVTGTPGSGGADGTGSVESGLGVLDPAGSAVPAGNAAPVVPAVSGPTPRGGGVVGDVATTLSTPTPVPGSRPVTAPVAITPTQIADSVQTFASSGLTLAPTPVPNNPGFTVAQELASIFGRPLIVGNVTNTDPKQSAPAPDAAILPNGAFVLNRNVSDAPVALVTHEITHALPDDVKETFLASVAPTLQNKEEFQARFLYGLDDATVKEIQAPVNGQAPAIGVQVQRLNAVQQRLTAAAVTPEQKASLAALRSKTDALVVEEMAAVISQEEAKTPKFWADLAASMGDNAFGRFAQTLVSTIDKLVAGYKPRSTASKWTNNLPAVRAALITALTEAQKRNLNVQPTPTPTAQGLSDGGSVRGGPGLLARSNREDQGNAGREADGSLKGLPRQITVGDRAVTASVFPAAVEAAKASAEKSGIPYTPPTAYAKVDKARATKIAEAYAELKHDPKNPEVLAAYNAMIDETLDQYKTILATGLKAEFIAPGQADPYADSPRLMIDDVRNNNHMWVFPTTEGFGSSDLDVSDNPLLAESGFEISGRPALANDIFRVVHDYFGHVKEGVGFRADGEENAWRAHSAMYSPLARRAMTSETRGQNSWVNFGPYGEQNRKASAKDTIYADQKVGLLPEWISEDTDAPKFAKPEVRPSEGVSTKAVHYGNAAGLSTLSGKSFGTGIRGAERARLQQATDSRIKQRVYFYLQEGEAVPSPEAGLGNNVYQANLQNIADANNPDHLDRIQAVRKGSDANAFESAVLDAGFDGYMNRGQGTVVVLGKDVPVKALGKSSDLQQQERRVTAAPAAPRTRVEGNELVRRPVARETVDVVKAQQSVPAIKMQYGEARVPASEREAANAALAALGSTFKFSRPATEADSVADQYAAVVAQYQNTDKWMKAPDGTVSKLTEKQWVQVRTPAFKKWFGDWEAGDVWARGNEVSKVVGPNGEPLVVYHGSDRAGFMEFQTPDGVARGTLGIFTTDNYQMARSYVTTGRVTDVAAPAVLDQAQLEDLGWEFTVLDDGRVELIDYAGYDVNGPADTGYRFASVEDAVAAANRQPPPDKFPGIYAGFVNLREPQEAFFDGAAWNGDRNEQYVVTVNGEQEYADDGSAFMRYDDAHALAEKVGGRVEEAGSHYETTDSVAKEARRIKADGAFIHDVVDEGPGPSNYFYEPSSVFILFDSNQIKSADFNTGEFGKTGDIRFSRPESNLTEAERGKLRKSTAQKFVDIFKGLPSGNEFAAVAYAGRAKRGWYRKSALAIEHVFGHESPRFAALLAAMSPQVSVESNLLNALQTWKNWVLAGRPQTREEIVQIMGRSVQGNKGANSVLDAWINNSVRALTSEQPESLVLSGPKVNSFALNLRGEVNEVTNDSWMANFALVDQKIFKGSLNAAGTDPGKSPGYLAMTARVREAAKILTQKTGAKWSPAEVQETVWSWAKTLYEMQDADVGARELVYDGALTSALISATPDFRTLFHEDRNENILRAAGYGSQLSTLRSRDDLSFPGDEVADADGETAPFDSETQGRYEQRAAGRLEDLRAGRLTATEGGDLRFSRPPVFYSELQRQIEQVPERLSTQPAAQWKLWLAGNSAKLGIKQDEITWSGINDYLDIQGKNKLTKADVSAYLDQAGVRVEEVVLGEQAMPKELRNYLDYYGPEDATTAADFRAVAEETGREAERNRAPTLAERARVVSEQAAAMADRLESGGETFAGTTTYSSYVAPGAAENYRELLIALPEKEPNFAVDDFVDDMAKKYGAETIYDIEGNVRTLKREFPQMLSAEDKVGFDKAIEAADKNPRVSYASSHWNTPNVVAHLRIDDRVDADGKKVLFVNEIQSDWGQEGKKSGFVRDSLPEGWGVFNDPKNGWYVVNKNKTQVGTYGSTREEAVANALNDTNGSVPAAPFVMKTESWVGLALKRATIYAAQNGYDKVALVSGEQAADFFDLSKKISAIWYQDATSGGVGRADLNAPEGSGMLTAYDKNGRVVINQFVEHDKLPDYIGKEAARKLLEQKPKHSMAAGLGSRLRQLEGLELQVGGEGMKAFYGQIVPQVARDVLKKIGGKLETVSLETKSLQAGDTDPTTGAVIGPAGVASESLQQVGFTITPEMRAKASNGLPMFSKPEQGDPNFARPPTSGQQYQNQLLGGTGFVLPTEGKFMKTRRQLQDYFLRVDTVQKAIVGQGGTIGEAQDVYRAEERSYGRMEEQLKDFARYSLEPLLEEAAASDIELEELALYAYAMHAPEANAYIASINPGLPDGGSGMTDAESAAIIAKARSEGKIVALDSLHSKLLGITDSTRRILLDEGLISQDEYDAWTNQYQYYIPLKGFAVGGVDGTPGLSPGRGFDIKGKETLRRLGRTSLAGDIIETIVKDFERAVTRGERNTVAKVFLDLALKNPDDRLWVVAPKTTSRGVDPATGQVRTNIVDDKGPDTVSVKVGGQEVRIKVKDELLLRAMKKASQDETGETTRFLMATVGWYGTWMRNTLTRYNPVFGAVNAVRDVQFGMYATYDELGAEGAKLFAKYYAQSAATAARYELGGLDQNARQTDKMFEEYRASGATTGGFAQRDVEEISGDLRRMLVAAGAKPRNAMERITASRPADAGRAALRTLEMIGSVSENAARFAAYQAAREMGRTPAQAASIAKNLTTNFNRKGEWGQSMNALYLFFNAAVQGSARTLQMMKNPRMQALFAGVVAFSAALAMFNADVGGEDEDGQTNWDKIPDYEKERNLIFMLPPGVNLEGTAAVGRSGRYLKIPLAYGVNIFPVLGNQIADVYRNMRDPNRGIKIGKAAINMGSAVFGSFNPMGGSFDPRSVPELALAVAPTLADLPVQMMLGVNAFGRPLSGQKFPGDTRPDSEVFSPRQAGGYALWMARKLNTLTDGNAARPGFIDVSASDIENLVRNAGGGTGQFLADVAVNIPTKLWNGEPLTNRDVPFQKQFFGRIDPTVNSGLAYERRNAALLERKRFDDEDKGGITREKVTPEQQRMLALSDAAKDFTKQMSQIRKEEIAFVENKENSPGAVRVRRKELELQRSRLAQQFNADFVKIQRAIKE